jgi:hypothetical protein
VTPPFLPGTEVLFMRDVVFGVVIPWLSMLPFVLVAIAAIEMFKGWLPSRLPDDPPTEPVPRIVVLSGRNGFAYRVDPQMPAWSPVDPTRFIGAGDP